MEESTTTASLPGWIIAAAGAIGLVGGAVIVFAGKAVKTWVGYKESTSKVTMEQKKGTTELEIHVTDKTNERWQKLVDEANKRADAAEARLQAAREEAQRLVQAERADCETRIQRITKWWQDREVIDSERMKERELQFQEMIDKLRHDTGEALSQAARRNEECLKESAELRGRVFQLERENAERKKEFQDIVSRLEAQSARRR